MGVVLVTGTIVTGTGPHSGDEGARGTSGSRSPPLPASMASRCSCCSPRWWRSRGGSVALTAAWPILSEPFTALLALAVVQEAIGYVQYLNDVPVVLVALHVAGAIAVWWATLRLELATRAPAIARAQSDLSGRIASAPTAR